jgi:hypothetical protein
MDDNRRLHVLTAVNERNRDLTSIEPLLRYFRAARTTGAERGSVQSFLDDS